MNRFESDNQDLFDEMCMLITARLAEEITSQQLARLEYLVINDDEARGLYIELMRQSDILRTCLADEASTNATKRSRDMEALRESLLAQRLESDGAAGQSIVEQLVPTASRIGGMTADTNGNGKIETVAEARRSVAKKYGLAAAIGICVMGVLIWILTPGPPPPPPQSVATLTESHHATWEDKDGRLIFIRDGKALPPQTLFLADGLAKLTFKDGAVVLLDARQRLTRFEIQSPSEGFLHIGKLAARADSEESKGYTVGIPGNMRVVDVSTEFGIIVEEDGRSQVHVIEGSVEAKRLNEQGLVVETIKVGESKAISLKPGEVQTEPFTIETEVAANAGEFQRVMPLKSIAKGVEDRETEQAKRWADYFLKLKSDSSLVYLLEGSSSEFDKSQKGQGRFGKNTAIQFSKSGDELTAGDEARWRISKNVTVAVWIKAEGASPDHALVVGKGTEPGRNYSLWVNQSADGGQVFHFAVEDIRHYNYHMTSSSVGHARWHLVVGVAQPSGVALFIDGRPISSAVGIFDLSSGRPVSVTPEIASSIQLLNTNDSPLRVGRSLEPKHPTLLQGSLDMVAIFNRALSEDEIKRMYDAGRP